MVEEEKKSFGKIDSPKIEKEKQYKIKSISTAVSTFQNPVKLRHLKISPGREITISLTENEKNEVLFVEYRGKKVKRRDITIEEIKTGAK